MDLGLMRGRGHGRFSPRRCDARPRRRLRRRRAVALTARARRARFGRPPVLRSAAMLFPRAFHACVPALASEKIPVVLGFNRSDYVHADAWYYGVSHGMAVAMIFRPRDRAW